MIDLLLHYFRQLPPTELKIALFIWIAIALNGGKPVDRTIADIAAGTGLSPTTVQEKRTLLRDWGVFQILSGPRERSRYAFPVWTTSAPAIPELLPAPEPPSPAMTENEEIVMLISEMTTAVGDPQFLAQAERIAGGRQRLLQCLRIMSMNTRRRLSGPSALSMIDRLVYQVLLARPA